MHEQSLVAPMAGDLPVETALAATRARRVRNAGPRGLHCSFCRTPIDAERHLTLPESRAGGGRSSTGCYCSSRCRSCVQALAALHPSPLAPSDFVEQRLLLTDRLLDLWRLGKGPDPVLVLEAAETATLRLKDAAQS
jgi:hypothetical protein